VDPSALTLQCPPTTLLTLVENAIRHGIDPGEEGGRIDVRVAEEGPRCLIRVSVTGVGLGGAASGAGSGLASLRERLQMFFGGETELRVSSNRPRGVIAEIEVPARR
jgi:LytS/YehU family sensor histidine kinase